MGRRILAIGAAVLLAIVGAALVLIYALRADDRALAGQQPQRVYVVSETVPSGTSLKEALRLELIEPTQVARAGLPAGALQSVDPSNQELLAVTDIPVGTYVLGSSFGELPLSEKAIEVPEGHLAVSVELTDPGRVGTFVTPGSRIAIYNTFKLKQLGDDDETQAFNDLDVHGTSVLLDDVLVLAMGQSSLTPTPAQPVAAEGTEERPAGVNESTARFLVTVAVTPEQSVRLVHSIQQYQLYAGLRSDGLEITPRNLNVDDLTVGGVSDS
jgi:pilus assembly protein CpaB